MNNLSIIGFGSIGQKHLKNFIKLSKSNKIYIVSERNHKSKNKRIFFLKKIEELIDKQVSLILICTPANQHLKNLSICLKFLQKDVRYFLEKPITTDYLSSKKFYNKNTPELMSTMLVGYQFSYSKAFNKLCKLVKSNYKKKILSVNVVCNSFLPNWRSNRDFRKSSSLKKTEGGGALLELSHEIDYIRNLFGSPTKVVSSTIQKNLFKSNIEESVSAFLIFAKNFTLHLQLNFNHEFNESRYCEINFENKRLFWNILENSITIISKHNKKRVIKFKDNYFETQSKYLLSIVDKKKKLKFNSFYDSMKNLEIIDSLKKSKKKNKFIEISK